jgi:hypothetical protein
MAEKIVAEHEYTDQELLALVREAIAKIAGFNQSYSIRGREYTRADLPALYKLEASLQARVSAASSGLAKSRYLLRRKP